MANSVSHPIARLGRSLSEIAREAGVSRVVLSMVVNGERDRPGHDTIRALVERYPQLDWKELSDWKWSKAKQSKRGRRRAS